MSLCWEYVCAFCMFWILTIFEFCAKSVTILENLIHFKADEGASRKLPTIWRLFLEKSLYFGIMRVWLSLFTIINIIHIKMPLIKTVLKHIQHHRIPLVEPRRNMYGGPQLLWYTLRSGLFSVYRTYF